MKFYRTAEPATVTEMVSRIVGGSAIIAAGIATGVVIFVVAAVVTTAPLFMKMKR